MRPTSAISAALAAQRQFTSADPDDALAGHGTGAYIMSVVEDVAEVEGFESALAPWWSFTKTVLAAAALVLVADGRLSLDALVHGRPFTLRHLLQHRAGLPEYGWLTAYNEAVANCETPWTRGELLRRVQADKLVFEPGQGWAYSNVGYMLVRELIENAACENLSAALSSTLAFSGWVACGFGEAVEERAWDCCHVLGLRGG